MYKNYSTERLSLDALKLGDAAFIMELVNTAEWIQFIGNRNINTLEQAEAYIQKIISNPDILYLVIRTHDQKIPVGIISFIKRAYLPHHDIGFAFLNEHKKQGYAFEAASVVLNDALNSGEHTHVLATTIKENSKSIQLLQKLGFSYYEDSENDSEPLSVYIKTA